MNRIVGTDIHVIEAIRLQGDIMRGVLRVNLDRHALARGHAGAGNDETGTDLGTVGLESESKSTGGIGDAGREHHACRRVGGHQRIVQLAKQRSIDAVSIIDIKGIGRMNVKGGQVHTDLHTGGSSVVGIQRKHIVPIIGVVAVITTIIINQKVATRLRVGTTTHGDRGL